MTTSWVKQLSKTGGIDHGTWQQRHYTERIAATHPVAVLLDGVTRAIHSYTVEDPHEFEGDTWPDANRSEGYGSILDGIIRLLNEDLGQMDGGTLWSEVAELAEVIHWDLDMSEIKWET